MIECVCGNVWKYVFEGEATVRNEATKKKRKKCEMLDVNTEEGEMETLCCSEFRVYFFQTSTL